MEATTILPRGGVELLLETAMRASEQLMHALWHNVDWNRCVLRLTGGKCGGREVPLSRGAVRVLRALRDVVPASEPRVLPTTYEALKRAWNVACEAADVSDVQLHDLRHTAATRYAIEFSR